MSAKNPNTVYFEQGTGKFISTYRTRPEWVTTFLKKNEYVRIGMEARAKNDMETLDKMTRKILNVNRKIKREGLYCEFVCNGKIKV